MAEQTEWHGYDGTAWNIAIGATEKIYFGGNPSGLGSVLVGNYQSASHRVDSGVVTDLCTPNHMRNCRYVSTTQVSLMEAAAVVLNTTNVAQTDCTLRFHVWDDAPANTIVENILFYADDGATAANPPADLTVVAFEHDGSAIQKDGVGGAGQAWDDANGIGGNGAALQCTNQASAADHYFYIGVSLKGSANGLKTAFRLAFQYDLT